ncbi:uncharacterized protein LOC143368992 isoform X2 [Andrena cerasifolii]|uniref:uncharacterized protein LOC143368992 isoform X2 n=1 Tax=Andrena cerasifolii TaxID=2819439 RepID=UPI004037830F
MNLEKSKSVWPDHVKASYTLSKLINKGVPSLESNEWNTCEIKKWFGSTDTNERTIEKRDIAMNTSRMLDCGATDQESYRNEFKQQRIKTERIHAFSEEEDLVHQPPQKKSKKLKTVFPRPPAPGMLELHSEEGFDAAPGFSSSPIADRHIELDNFNETSEFAMHFTPESHISHNIARPEPALSTEMRPVASGSIFPKSEFPDVQDDISPTEYQTFVMRKLSEISIYVRDISERLQRIEDKIYQYNRGNNIDTHYVYDDTELGLPVQDEVNLLNLEAKLHDPSVFNNMVHILKRSGGSNVAITTATILNKLIGSSLAENYSWHGRKQKKPFANFSHIVKLILRSVHAACSEKQYRCTDADITSAGAKWLAQSKTRSKRIEIRSNKNNGISMEGHVHMRTTDYRNI